MKQVWIKGAAPLSGGILMIVLFFQVKITIFIVALMLMGLLFFFEAYQKRVWISQELQERQATLEAAVEHYNMQYLTYYPKEQQIFLSKKIQQRLSMPAMLKGTEEIRRYKDRLHPKDRDRVLKMFRK